MLHKGEKSDCSDYQGISLLSIAENIHARIQLNRLIPINTEEHLLESQCDFRTNRSTTDIMFILRELQEKCQEQNREMYVTFISLTKAFKAMSREGM